MRLPRIQLAAMLLTLLLGWGCKEDPEDKTPQYDRAALATQMADGLIRPGYDRALAAATRLDNHVDAFAAAPGPVGLDSLQTALQALRHAWLSVSAYEFGPGASLYLRQAINTFPSDANQLEANISSGNWNLDLAQNADARGLPALDYLLHGSATDDATILGRFTDPADSAGCMRALRSLVDDVRGLLQQAVTDWASYRSTFIANTGTDVSSATSYLVNQFNLDIEQLKNARIGIPLGKTTLGQPVLANVESRYGGYSVALAITQLRALRDLFQGKTSAGIDGYGLDDALLAVGAQRDGRPLKDVIFAGFDSAIAAMQAVPDPLEATITSNPALVDAAYTQLQRLVVYTKTDMPSSLGILITYTDNDGD